jgi:hypothetical protein
MLEACSQPPPFPPTIRGKGGFFWQPKDYRFQFRDLHSNIYLGTTSDRSVDEYFEHFRVLEIDFNFYHPLTEKDGTYEKAHPFDKIVEGMLQPKMIEGTSKLIHVRV